ncbi:SLBB domain-containing protein [candidate division KSB1 bacterium]|nr:SLBB domain-containing protein [candidate division KSB1 bacterium]
MRKLILSLTLGGLALSILVWPVFAQENLNQKTPKEDYLIGEEQNLEIIVHIWGEVKDPGEKRVPDGTNVGELVSKAGGPGEYSKLSNVILYRDPYLNPPADKIEKLLTGADDFIKEDYEELQQHGKVEINLKKYLENGKASYLPILIPGDVVEVKRNNWYTWQSIIRVASQVAIIAQVWYWYSNAD